MNRPFIDPNEIDRIMGRQPHRLHRPYKGDGTWQPTANEMRFGLILILVVVFVLFGVAK